MPKRLGSSQVIRVLHRRKVNFHETRKPAPHLIRVLNAHRPTPPFVAARVRVKPAPVKQAVVDRAGRNEVGGNLQAGVGNERGQACSHPRSSRREEALTIPQRSTWRVAEFSQSLVTSAATFHLAFIHHDAMQEQRARVVYSNT